MVKFEASAMVDRPVEDVWKFITDYANYPKWDPVIIELRKTSDGPLGVGATLEVRHSNMTIPERVIEYEPNRKFAFVVTSGPGKGTTGTFSVENIEGKTRLTETDDFKFNGFFKLVGPFLTRSVKRQAVARVGKAKQVLESEAKS
jgi:uncharacterized protein YndB with AHSA1/START domain